MIETVGRFARPVCRDRVAHADFDNFSDDVVDGQASEENIDEHDAAPVWREDPNQDGQQGIFHEKTHGAVEDCRDVAELSSRVKVSMAQRRSMIAAWNTLRKATCMSAGTSR